MYTKFRQYHLMGAIGGFLTAFAAILSLVASASYYISTEWLLIVNMLFSSANGMLAAFFFGMFSLSSDSLIKIGSLIAGIGLVFNIFIFILQMAGVYVMALALIGGLVMITGIVMVCIKYIIFFQKDAFVIVFCVFIFMGLLLSLFWSWAGLLSGSGLGGLLIYFYVHNVTY